MTTNQYSSLFRLAVKCMKYFFLGILGFAVVYFLSIGLNLPNIFAFLLPFMTTWVLNLGIIVLCLMLVAMIFESLR